MGHIRRLYVDEGFRLAGPQALEVVLRTVGGSHERPDAVLEVIAESGSRYLPVFWGTDAVPLAEGVSIGIARNQRGGRKIGLYCEFDERYTMERL